MLERLQSLELPMAHINHWWPLRCIRMGGDDDPPLCTTILPTAVTQSQTQESHECLSFPLSLSCFFLYLFLALSHVISLFSPLLLSPTQHACTEAFILSCSHPIFGPCWPWTGPCQAESRWLKEKGYAHYTD